jgi:citrate lyase subunit beta/citryl-CoA lyase
VTGWRSLLYVSGHHIDRVAKALCSKADCVILDLEDSVPPAEKDRAREHAARVISQPGVKPVLIRINAVGGPWHEADIAALAQVAVLSPSFSGIRIPKAENSSQVREINDALSDRFPLHLLIESAQGLDTVRELASTSGVASISLGEADLSADLSWSSAFSQDYARTQLVIAARAARLMQPSGSVFTNLTDTAGLTSSTVRLKELGFFGRSVIHPKQIDAVNEIFTPTPSEVRQAQELVADVAFQSARGISAFTRIDGSFIDPALVRHAKKTLSLHHQISSKTTDDLMEGNGS